MRVSKISQKSGWGYAPVHTERILPQIMSTVFYSHLDKGKKTTPCGSSEKEENRGRPEQNCTDSSPLDSRVANCGNGEGRLNRATDFWGETEVKLLQIRSLVLSHFHGYLNSKRECYRYVRNGVVH